MPDIAEGAIIKAALRRLLARAAHADTMARAASHAVAKGDDVLRDALTHLVRAVIDGPAPSGDEAFVTFKAYLPAEDVARELIATRGWPCRADAPAWLAEIINGVRDERSTFPHPLPEPVQNALSGMEHASPDELLDLARTFAASDEADRETRQEKADNALIVAICALRAYEELRR